MFHMGNEQSAHRSRSVLLSDDNMSVRLRNNYYPLHFHQVHGENVQLTKNRSVASRLEGFCNGLVFSDRPVQIGEKVYIKFLETSPNWSGALRIGFTCHDPLTLRLKLPRYVCPDLTSMHGNWGKAVAEKFARKDSVLHYHVDQNGDVHYGIGNEEYGIFFGGVNTACRLWAVLDIYGNTVSIEFLGNLQSSLNEMEASLLCSQTKKPNRDGGTFPMTFHPVHGKNLMLRGDRKIAARKDDAIHFAIAFTEQPLLVDKTVLMLVHKVDDSRENILVYGITSCNPSTIDPNDLPQNIFDLLERPEYWIVNVKDNYPWEIGDALMLRMTNEGKIDVFTHDDVDPAFHVDTSQPLWAFVYLVHAVSEMCILGSFSDGPPEVYELAEGVKRKMNYKKNQLELHNSAATSLASSHQSSSGECMICCEEQVNCAIYRCGHMCMCYACACKVWTSGSGAQCPVCRNPIVDVIKVYK